MNAHGRVEIVISGMVSAAMDCSLVPLLFWTVNLYKYCNGLNRKIYLDLLPRSWVKILAHNITGKSSSIGTFAETGFIYVNGQHICRDENPISLR
jgi:hypothetical protein